MNQTKQSRAFRSYFRRTLPVLLPSLAVAVLTVAYVAHAVPSPPTVVPMLLGVQGYVTDAKGSPLNGNQNVTLSLYTTDIGGSNVFSETQNVTFESGVMSVQLGRSAPLDPMKVVYPNPQLFLGVTIAGGAELSPRVRITSSTYAIQAQHAAVADTATNGVPPGTITAFGGTTAPPGWLICDGSILDPVAQPQYAGLQAALSEAWGDGGDGAQPKFTLPDLRGVFLRGVDGSAQRDPDASSRTAPWNGTGNTGNAVGSFEGASFASHMHELKDGGHAHQTINGLPGDGYVQLGGNTGTPCILAVSTGGACGAGGVANPSTSPSGANVSMAASGGSETRPVNANVTYIIKY